ncbi:MAG: amidohydrolase family protein [Candidatus Coatesbacteria bacterium]|nr:amidohydrolase family protein [Candidatus Coatesbacteria bacterium]
MRWSDLVEGLFKDILELKTIDAHEHLLPEEEYLEQEYCGLNLFAGGYIYHDLESAGMPASFKGTMRLGGYRPVAEWWPQIAPYWENVKTTSFSNALRITVRDLYGIQEIDADTIGEIAARVQSDNRRGIYDWIFEEKCKISKVIDCIDRTLFPRDPRFVGITELMKVNIKRSDCIQTLAARSGHSISNLNDFEEAGFDLLERDIRHGSVGFKTIIDDRCEPDKDAAEKEFTWLKSDPTGMKGRFSSYPKALSDYLFDRWLNVAARANVPVAVHSGYWGDFRKLDPKFIYSFAPRRSDIHFDLFHLGMPMVREAAMIGKNLPNVSLNLTWCPIISQRQTISILNEIIDLVPLNKIIAFGGDYRVCVQKVYGHLVMMKEVLATILGDRIQSSDFGTNTALKIAQRWLYDNAIELYHLGVAR